MGQSLIRFNPLKPQADREKERNCAARYFVEKCKRSVI